MKTTRTQPKPESKSNRFIARFTPETKKRHIRFVTGTNEVGPSRILIGGLKS